jgi:hypothetical protein
MPPTYNTLLSGIDSITKTSFYDQVIANLISYFDWGLLNIGAFFNISRQVGARGILTLSTDPDYTAGTVWESTRANWVWETGIAYSTQPTTITGIYINSIFTANDNSVYKVDYTNGRIIFNSPQSSSSIIELNYAYKVYNFYDADTDWFRQVVFDVIDEPSLTELLAVNRVYLPAIIVEYVPRGQMVPYQIGTAVDRHQDQDFLFHIISDSYQFRNKVVDVLLKQFETTIYLYNIDLVAQANAFGLGPDGSLNHAGSQYPTLVSSYFWALGQFLKVRSEEVTKELGLFRATVRVTMRIDQF